MIDNFNIKWTKKDLVKYLREASLIIRKNELSLLEVANQDIRLVTVSDYGKSSGVGCVFKDNAGCGGGTAVRLIDIKQLLTLVKGCLSDTVELRHNGLDKDIEVISCEDGHKTKLNTSYFVDTVRKFNGYTFDIKGIATQWIRFSKEDLQEILKKVSYAQVKKEHLYYDEKIRTMGGINFNKIGDKLEIVATDGCVLSMCSINTNDYIMSDGDFNHTIGSNHINVLLKKLKQKSENEEYTIYFHSDSAVISNGITDIMSSTLYAVYPDYKKVIDHVDLDGACVKINKQETIEAIEKIAPGCDDNKKMMRVEIIKDKMLLSSPRPSDTDTEDNENTLKSEVVIDNTLEGYVFGINYKYFIDTLKAHSAESLSMYVDIYEGENKKKYNGNPIAFIGDNNYNNISLVMPMKLTGGWGS